MTKPRTTTRTKRPPATRGRTTVAPRSPERDRQDAQDAHRALMVLIGREDEKGRPLTTAEAATPSGAVRLVSVHVKDGGKDLLREVRLYVKEGAEVPTLDVAALFGMIGDLFGFDVGPCL